METVSNRKKVEGEGQKTSLEESGGQRTVLVDLEETLMEEITEMRLRRMKVARDFIADRARQLAEGHNVPSKVCDSWVTMLMKRHELSLRLMTNLITVTDGQRIQRAVDYMSFLRNRINGMNKSATLLMDETTVYFEDARMQTVDIRGRHHVVIKSTGFSSIKISAVIGVWADGHKAPPLIIHKGKDANNITRHPGPILSTTQPKAWVNADLIIR
jgi:hypothetical protein